MAEPKPEVTVDEVFDAHKDLLFALMDGGNFPAIVAVLDIYAQDITKLDQITHQPNVTVLEGVVLP